MNPKSNFLNFTDLVPNGVDPSDYSVVIMTDPQFGKFNREHGGDGTHWTLDQNHMLEFCRYVNR